jgi:3-oxoacyl-(acyl-carrier-protein) synthase
VNRVFVTGLGIITPLGDTVELNRQALISGQCGITNLELFPSKYSTLLPFAEIKIENQVLQNKL